MRIDCAYTPGRVVETDKRPGLFKGRWKYRPRANDASTIEKASFLTVKQTARVGGFDPDFNWPPDKNLAYLMIGNSVSPSKATQVMLEAKRAGLVKLHYRPHPVVQCAVEINLTTEAKMLRATVSDT